MKKIFECITSAFVIAVFASCSLADLVNVDKPQLGTDIDHKYLDTREGSLGLLYSTLGSLQAGVSKAALEVGLFTDELTARPYNSSIESSDTRVEFTDINGIVGISFPAYSDLQAARVRAGHARYFLRRQNDSTLNFAISAAYAYEGYAIMMLAENLCSGVPLSEAPYGGTAVYGRAIPSDSLFRIAISKFDSSLVIQHDSASYITLAKIGKGRALMSIGMYEKAAQAVSDIPTSADYNIYYTEAATSNPNSVRATVENAFWTNTNILGVVKPNDLYEIVNLEGNNGLMWFTDPESIDPRLPVTVTSSQGVYTFPAIVRQMKFINGNVVLKLASGIEARMIEAEYQLSTNDPHWIEEVNEARRTLALSDLVSPSITTQKIDLLFNERALWFYGHATRLSDMRRLVRQYGRIINSVYPVGSYNRSAAIYTYGDATVFIPTDPEFMDNYNYSGCINRNP